MDKEVLIDYFISPDSSQIAEQRGLNLEEVVAFIRENYHCPNNITLKLLPEVRRPKQNKDFIAEAFNFYMKLTLGENNGQPIQST